MNINEQANFIWSIADLLRGDFKQSEYGKVILPFTVLRRFDCVLAPSKAKILEANKTLTVSNKRPIFKRMTGHDYYNVSQFDFEKLMDDSNAIEANLRDYINGFSEDVREIMDNFEIFGVIDRLSRANLLYLVVQRFAEIDMSDTQIDNLEMGYMFEELIRRFSEQSNETAGEHFTPREVIELMVEVLLDPDMDEIANTDGRVITILDPACGTGGMLSVAQNKMESLNSTTQVIPFGQELNPETYATCRSDMILKGNTNSRIVLGNSFNEDGFKSQTFDYMLSNPPFGVEWKKVEKFIKDEAASQGYRGRFGAGLPRISDGSFLFLQHLISKMNPPEKGGSRIGIVFNGSPMFSGDAGSGESEIRRWIIENDLLEAIIGLPDQLFYNTGITTYIWILTNRKENRRKGKVRLINGAGFFEKMRKGLGNKRNMISPENRAELVRLYSTYEPDENYMDLDNEDFGYRKIVIERPLLNEDGTPAIDRKGNRIADASLRDYEMVPLKEDIHEYFRREVLPFVSDAWIDESKTKIGYEIPFTRYFYKFTPLRDSSVIMEDIRALEERIQASLAEVFWAVIEHKEFTDIPTCWNSSKVRYIYSITKAKMPAELLDNPEDGTEIYLSMDVIRKRNENLQYSHTGDLATEDDMLLLWDGSNAGEIIDKHPRGFAPSTTAILKNISSNNRRYCFYAMKYLERFIRSNTVGMGVPHVDGDYLKSLRFITPSKCRPGAACKLLGSQNFCDRFNFG